MSTSSANRSSGTYFQSKESGLENRKWLVVDAAGIPLGRLASEVAALLRGKHKPTFTTHVDGGDYVIVLNASQVKFTGNKALGKIYYHHTSFIGGLKQTNAGDLLEKNPERVIELAVRGMLPKGPLGRAMGSKLKIFAGSEHTHSAQTPEVYKLKYVNN